ncbi:hypothetical protein KJ656_04295, partial [bacterium]|nr:hypothetical protein [bacterium]
AFILDYVELDGHGFYGPYEGYWDYAAYTRGAFAPSELPSPGASTTTCVGFPNDDFKQSDTRWATHPYNTQTPTYTKTIGRAGCALSALATLVNYYSETFPELNISMTNPKILNDIVEHQIVPKTNGFYNHDIKFTVIESTNVSNAQIILNGTYNYSPPLNSITKSELRNIIDSDLNENLPIIVRVYRSWINPNTNNKEEWHHFVLIVGKCGDKYIMSDPGSNTRVLLNPVDSVMINTTTQSMFGPIDSIRRFKKK